MKLSSVLKLSWVYITFAPLILICLPIDSAAPKIEFAFSLIGLSLFAALPVYITFIALTQGIKSPATEARPNTFYDKVFRVIVCIAALPPFLLGLLAVYENMNLSTDEVIKVRVIGKHMLEGRGRTFARGAIVYEQGSETKQRKVTWSFYNEVSAGDALEIKVTDFYGFWKEATLLGENRRTFYYIDRGRAAWPFLMWALTFLGSPSFFNEPLKGKGKTSPSKTKYRATLGFALFILLIFNSILSSVYIQAL